MWFDRTAERSDIDNDRMKWIAFVEDILRKQKANTIIEHDICILWSECRIIHKDIGEKVLKCGEEYQLFMHFYQKMQQLWLL